MEECPSQEVEGILVQDVMSKNIIKVKPGDSVIAVGNLLAEKRISGAVVMEANNVAGVISKESFVTGVKYMGVNPLSSFKVKDFMAEGYESAQADEKLNDVVDRINLSPRRVDRVLVFSKGHLTGILTKSDIARVFSEHAKGCFRVRDLMQLSPIIVYDYTPIKKIISEITLSHDKRVIVMAGQKVLGVITVLDVSLALFEKLKEHKDKDVLDIITLDDLITLDPLIVSDIDDAADAARIMVEKRVGGLPVYNNGLKGVITKTDIVKGYQAFKGAKKKKV
jgi:predicted transcriptional regulator